MSKLTKPAYKIFPVQSPRQTWVNVGKKNISSKKVKLPSEQIGGPL